MKDKNAVVLEKILNEISIAHSMMGSCTIERFQDDEMVKRAVSMTIINIGELVKNLDMDFREKHPQVPWKAIAGFRDIAAHKYQTLRMEDVYVTAKDELPVLAEEIEAILKEGM